MDDERGSDGPTLWAYPESPDTPAPEPGDLLRVIADGYDGHFIVSGVGDGQQRGCVSLGLIVDPENQS